MAHEYRLSLEETCKLHGFSDFIEMCEEYIIDSVCPACCTEECEVEHDGTCEHGCPSIMMEAGII